MPSIKLNQMAKEDIYQVLKDIIDNNPHCYISGGIALQLQKVNIRREPKDIDLYVPFEHDFKIIDGMKEAVTSDFDGSGADPDAIEMLSYRYRGYSIDVFKPINPEFNLKFETFYANPYKCLPKDEIIRFKIVYAFDTSFSKWKHKDDIIHMMVNN